MFINLLEIICNLSKETSISWQLNPIWLIAASLLIALVPVIFGFTSAYVKTSIVLNMLKSGFGSQGIPSSLVVMSLSCCLTFIIMGPVWEASYQALSKLPLQTFNNLPDSNTLVQLEPVLEPWRNFLERHSGESERVFFLELNKQAADQKISLGNLMAAFLVSELKQAFTMGFVLLVPFLAIDLIVANILTGLGMIMASPVMISLPLKVFVFIIADGWLLLTQGLIKSYGV